MSRNVVFVVENEEIAESDHETVEEGTEVTEIEISDWSDPESDSEPEVQRALFVHVIPKSFSEVMTFAEVEKNLWLEAVGKELSLMKKYSIWKEVPNEDFQLVDTCWVFVIKETLEGPLMKARLVARGFQNKDHGVTYAPIASIMFVRILLSLVVHFGLHIVHLDIETAFLNGELKETIYLKPPEGLDVKSGHVLKLLKSIYGLKQSPRNWYDKLDGVLKDMGFKQSGHELCFYYTAEIYLLIYVDDILVLSKEEKMIEFVISELRKFFSVKVMKPLTSFLGIEIGYKEGTLILGQKRLIKCAVPRFSQEESKKVRTPMEINLDLFSQVDDVKMKQPFQELLGVLNYIMGYTRILVSVLMLLVV